MNAKKKNCGREKTFVSRIQISSLHIPWHPQYATTEKTAGFAPIHQSYFHAISSACCIVISPVAFVSTFSQFLFLFMLGLAFHILNHVLGTGDVRHNLPSLSTRISKLSGPSGDSKYDQFTIYSSQDVSLHLFRNKENSSLDLNVFIYSGKKYHMFSRVNLPGGGGVQLRWKNGSKTQ
jgi:hypothetical protein